MPEKVHFQISLLRCLPRTHAGRSWCAVCPTRSLSGIYCSPPMGTDPRRLHGHSGTEAQCHPVPSPLPGSQQGLSNTIVLQWESDVRLGLLGWSKTLLS